jgi:hypothetical protein
VQASPPALVIKLSDDEPEEEPAKDQEQGGDPDGHSNPEDGGADDQPVPEKWEVVVCHHDGGHARFPSKLRRLFQRLHLHVTIDYVGLKRTHPRYPMQWEVSVRILEDNPQEGGQYEVIVHHALATRATFTAGEMMLLEGLFLHGVMRRLTISLTLCGVAFPVDVLELWAA